MPIVPSFLQGTAVETHARNLIVALAQKLIGTPYIWGGSTPRGFDCSGFVIWVLQVFDVLPSGDWTADQLRSKFLTTDTPKPGDLVFYGTPVVANHVGFYIGKLNGADMMVGANGGDHTCTTEEIAKQKNAMVKMKPVAYRRDFLGYGSILGYRATTKELT